MVFWKRASLVGVGVLFIVGTLMSFTELAVNKSASLPHHYFLIVKGISVDRGDCISIKGHHPLYTEDLHFIKRIEGLSGDEIAPLLTDLKAITRKGENLSPLALKTVPEGYVFVRADHPDSYDSRYEEFGLVSVEHIKGRAFPVGGMKK